MPPHNRTAAVMLIADAHGAELSGDRGFTPRSEGHQDRAQRATAHGAELSLTTNRRAPPCHQRGFSRGRRLRAARCARPCPRLDRAAPAVARRDLRRSRSSAAALWVLHHELRAYSYKEVMAALRGIPRWRLRARRRAHRRELSAAHRLRRARLPLSLARAALPADRARVRSSATPSVTTSGRRSSAAARSATALYLELGPLGERDRDHRRVQRHHVLARLPAADGSRARARAGGGAPGAARSPRGAESAIGVACVAVVVALRRLERVSPDAAPLGHASSSASRRSS